MTQSDPMARLERLIAAARRIADPADALGREARERLPMATGLSPEGVEYALVECLETDPSPDELGRMIDEAVPARRVWVSLSANVFTAAHRAVALGLASGGDVRVRPSRREPVFVELLARAAGDPFEIVDAVAPEPGDTLLAYGTDETLGAIEPRLPPGVRYVAHGSGMGLVWLTAPRDDARDGDESVAPREEARDVDAMADCVASDVVPFDQQGCLSPRVVVVERDRDLARRFAHALAASLERFEQTVPTGVARAEEAAGAARYRETLLYHGHWLEAGHGGVGLDLEGARLIVPPAGRHVHVVATDDVPALVQGIAATVTCVGTSAPWRSSDISGTLPRARQVALGRMQRPPFDGPVDRRSSGKIIGVG